MSDNQCPDAGTWKTFLDGDVLDEAAADLAAHLEDCEACQQTLERLAAGKETWEGTAGNLPKLMQRTLLSASNRVGICGMSSTI